MRQLPHLHSIFFNCLNGISNHQESPLLPRLKGCIKTFYFRITNKGGHRLPPSDFVQILHGDRIGQNKSHVFFFFKPPMAIRCRDIEFFLRAFLRLPNDTTEWRRAGHWYTQPTSYTVNACHGRTVRRSPPELGSRGSILARIGYFFVHFISLTSFLTHFCRRERDIIYFANTHKIY